MKDISYLIEENKKFNFRVGGIFLNNDKILLQKSDTMPFYGLIGGRVKYFEDTLEAFIRETKEETGVLLKKEEVKLIKIVENFFPYGDMKVHELFFLYLVENNEELNKMNNFKTLDSNDEINAWYNIEDIKNMDIRPRQVYDWVNNKNLSQEIIKDI